MAKKRQPEPEATVEDPYGAELIASIAANEALFKALQHEFAQQMVRSQSGEDDPPSATDLAALKKLEREIQNDKLFAEARRLTRRGRANG